MKKLSAAETRAFLSAVGVEATEWECEEVLKMLKLLSGMIVRQYLAQNEREIGDRHADGSTDTNRND